MSAPITFFAAKKIVTMNGYLPEATAVAVREGKILCVGTLDECRMWGDGTIDDTFKDHVLVPGFIEGHGHTAQDEVVEAVRINMSWRNQMSHVDQPPQQSEISHNAADRQVPKIRYIFVLPIISAFAASIVLLVLGFLRTFRVIFEVLAHGEESAMTVLKLEFIEVIDVFLLATILWVIASGFYQLFLSRGMEVAPWMRVSSVHDLEVMLIGVTVTLLGVTGLSSILSWDGHTDLLPFGATIALIIAALAFFLGRSQHG